MSSFLIRAFAAACLCLALLAPHDAAFHTYRIVEIFSSVDGTVQFIKLNESGIPPADFQNSWGGLQITATDSTGTMTHAITFTNLPSTSTASTSVLIATHGFGLIPGGQTPDFEIPPGFLFLNGGSVNFAFSTSLVSYTGQGVGLTSSLPTDGNSSIKYNTTGGVITNLTINAPRNFAAGAMGAAGHILVPPGSCCIGSNCTLTIQSNCSGGTWINGGSCNPSPCTPPTGSCCATNGSCTVTTQAQCSGGSTWTSGGTCTPNTCQQPTGSCCLVSGSCNVTTQAACNPGTWTQGGTCSPNTCPQPTGACCNGVICSLLTAAQCTGAITRFAGAGTQCNLPGDNQHPCCKADYNQNTVIDVTDIFAFLGGWFSGSPAADFNGIGTGQVTNIFAFLGAWFARCQ